MEKFIIIDGNSLVNRAFYALPPMTSDGKPVQAVYGFATMLVRMAQTYRPSHMAVAFDMSAPTFRHKRYDGYKATRKHMPDDLAAQMQPLKNMLSEMDVKILEKEGYEADDIIGTLSKRFGIETYIVTGDRDSLQLIDDSTRVVLTKRGITEVSELDEMGLKNEYGLTPKQVIEYKAIAGDSSDNIPGVGGIGDKGAMQLLSMYGDLDGVYENLSSISSGMRNKLENCKEQAYLSRELATIDTNVPIDCELSDCVFRFPFGERVKRFFLLHGFKSLLKREELFETETAAPLGEVKKAEIIEINDPNEFKSALEKTGREIAVVYDENRLSFAFDEDTEYRVGIAARLDDNYMPLGTVTDIIGKALSDSEVLKVVYDAKRMKKVLRALSLDIEPFWDVKLAQYVDDVNVQNDTLSELLEVKGMDADAPASGLMRLKGVLSDSVSRNGLGKVLYELEFPLVNVLISMEDVGFKLDLKMLNELGRQFKGECEDLTRRVYAFVGHEFNINSPKQLATVLFEELKLPYPRKGPYSTNADILQRVPDESGIIDKILAYRSVSKLNSTYVEGLRKKTDPQGVVHTEFRQTATATGRLSSVEPNLQNIPVREEMGQRLRAIFTAREGNTLVSADYSQIELRLLAHFSGDEILTRAYLSGEDVHASTAAAVFGVDISEVTPRMRREAKAVNFGIIYGISDFGLAQNIHVGREQAKRYIEQYFRRFPSVKAYLDGSVDQARKRGYALTLMGRRRNIPELFSSQYTVRQFGERVAMNTPLQGSAADIIKKAMITADARLKGMKSRLILQIHDELIIEAADEEIEQVKNILKDSLENAVSLSVPLTVDIGMGKSWIDC